MQYLKPRSWRIRYEAAKHRATRDGVMADLRAVRAAHYHGTEPPADAVARLAEIEARKLAAKEGREYVALQAEQPVDPLDDTDEPAKPAPRGRKASA